MKAAATLRLGGAAIFILGVACGHRVGAVELFSEDFDSLTPSLKDVVTFDSEIRARGVWTDVGPTGWTVDNSMMSTIGDPNTGVAEFEGWRFVDKDWWIETAGDQNRSQFVSGRNVIAVADPDEWDDFGTPDPSDLGDFDSRLTTPSIPLNGIGANSAKVFLHSSWRHEVDQKATLIATYNTGQTVDLLKWNSAENDPNFLDFEFKEDAENEALILDLQNPAGASSVQLEFRVFDAGNNWWWAFDNLQVFTGDAPASGGALKVVVDRDSGVVRIVNGTDAAVDLRGFSVQSSAGVFDEAAATFLSDSDSDWIRATRSDDEANDLSELHLTSSQLAPGAEIDFGAVWEPFYQDLGDLSFEYLTEQQDEPIKGIVEFVGNDDESFGFLDLNHNGSIEIGDWEAFKAGFGTDLTGLTLAVRHNLGDLDHDGEHTTLDFLEFQNRFNQANGPGAFAAALSAAPEPTTAGLLTLIGVAGLLRFRRHAALLLVSAACGLGLVSNTAHAQLTLFAEDFESLPLGSNVEEITNGDEVWTSTPPAGWTIDNSGMPGDRNVETENGVVEWYGWNFADKDWWTLAAGDQDRGQFSRGQGTVMIADPDEWDDADGPAREAIATAGGGANYFDSFAKTPVISIPGGVPANRIELAFDSSWRDEAFDDLNNTNNQTATVRVRYDGGAWQNVLTWDSDPESNNFHDDAPNERVARIDLGYDGTASTMELEFGLGNAWNDWWWAVDNLLVSVNPDPAVLRVNTFNGQAFLEGGDVINVGIQSIDIQSENGVLSASGPSGLTGANPTQVDGPDPGDVAGDSSGEQWEMLTASENRVFEAFLYGESIFNNSTSVDLGILMNAGTAAADRDLTFSYSNPIGDITAGIVEYFFDDSVGLAGDFNNDGTVDAADYTVWRDGLGSTYTQSDYNVWRSNYGQSLAAAPSATAAPEPLSLGVLLVGMLALLCLRPARGVALGCAVVACCCLPAGEATAYTLDRDYQFGDDPAENTSGSVEVTFDSAGTPTPAGQPALNQLIDITGYGKIGIKPSYVDIGPLGRPDGGTGKGIRLNQNPILKQYVASQFGEALNFPERSASSTFAEPPGSIDYEIISDRGFQLWTMPSQIPAAGARADIVMDSNQHGVYIDGDTGAFGMRYAAKPFLKQEDVDLGLTLFEEQAKSDYLSDVTAEANTWYHLSVVRPFGPNNGSILYVDGVAVAAATGTYAIERVVNLDVDLTNILDLDTAPLVIGANTGMESGLAGSRNYYSGVVDDLEMFVMGINSSQDFGEYEFARDNGYAAAFGPSVDGDINNDDAVTLADAQLFAANWLYEKRLEWTVDDVEQSLVVGDLESRTRGDFNYDGRVDLADWAILNNANPSTAAAALRLMAGGAVPEPAAAVLITLALAAFGKTRRRGEESQRQ